MEDISTDGTNPAQTKVAPTTTSGGLGSDTGVALESAYSAAFEPYLTLPGAEGRMWRLLCAASTFRRPTAVQGTPNWEANRLEMDEFCNFLKGLIEDAGLQMVEDSYGNMAVYDPGVGEGVGKPPVIEQSHVDIVHNFEDHMSPDGRQPIPTQFEEVMIQDEKSGDFHKWFQAIGSTAGFDNFAGLVASLAMAGVDVSADRFAAFSHLEIDQTPEEEVVRSPRIIIMTRDEEKRLMGARKFDPSVLPIEWGEPEIIINTDGGVVNEILVACGGGGEWSAKWDLNRQENTEGLVPFKVSISGLKGGHSGIEIHQNRGNSANLLATALKEYGELQLGSFEIPGGVSNIIPARAEAVIWIPEENVSTFRSVMEGDDLRQKLEGMIEEGSRGLLNFTAESIDDDEIRTNRKYLPTSFKSSREIIEGTASIPVEVQTWFEDEDRMARLSNNLATVITTEDSITVGNFTRSRFPEDVRGFMQEAQASLTELDAHVVTEEPFAGWDGSDPVKNPMIGISKEAIEAELGIPAEIVKSGGGVETGTFMHLIKSLKAGVTLGMTRDKIHEIGECMRPESLGQFYRILVRIHARLAAQPIGAI